MGTLICTCAPLMNTHSNKPLLMIIAVIAIIVGGYWASSLFNYSSSNSTYLSEIKDFSPVGSIQNGRKLINSKEQNFSSKSELLSSETGLFSTNLPDIASNNTQSEIKNTYTQTATPDINVKIEAYALHRKPQIPTSNSTISTHASVNTYSANSNKYDVTEHRIETSNFNHLQQSNNTFATSTQNYTNNRTASFLANNTLIIATEIITENDPMMVSGDSNPGDPGIIPIGDGTMILMILLAIYGLKLCIKRAMVMGN